MVGNQTGGDVYKCISWAMHDVHRNVYMKDRWGESYMYKQGADYGAGSSSETVVDDSVPNLGERRSFVLYVLISACILLFENGFLCPGNLRGSDGNQTSSWGVVFVQFR